LAAERALHFTLHIAFGNDLALVAFAATTCKRKFNFDFSINKLDGEGDKRQAFACNAIMQALNF
jgi:hypothetical protein